MRYLTAILLTLALAAPALAQKAAVPGPSDLEQQLFKELTKFEYKAKRDIPAADSIFVEKGKIQEAMYKLSLQQGGVLLKSGKSTKVSSVKIMDHGVQVFFETDKCAMINLAAENEDVPKLTLPKLVEFAKTSIAALFQVTALAEQPPAENKDKPAEEKKTPS